MSFRCANCQHIFAESQAQSDNWMDPKRNLICPYCKVALVRAARPPIARKQRLKRVNGVHLIWVLVFFLVLVLIDRNSGLPYAFPYVASLLALLAVVFYGWFSGSEPEATETVDIILNKSTTENVYEFKPRD